MANLANAVLMSTPVFSFAVEESVAGGKALLKMNKAR